MIGLDIIGASQKPTRERWRHVGGTNETPSLLGVDASTAEIVTVTHQLNRIYAHHEVRPDGVEVIAPNVITNAIAARLVNLGLDAIDRAAAIMPHGLFLPSQQQTIANIRNALLAHQQNVTKGDPTAPYAGKEQLRKDSMTAFVELSGATQAATDADRVSYWSEVYDRLAAIGDEAYKIAKAIADAAGTIIKEIPKGVKTAWWTIVALVGGAVVLAGVLAWKLISSGTVRDVGTAMVKR